MLILVSRFVFRTLLGKREILMVDSLVFAIYFCKWNLVDKRYESRLEIFKIFHRSLPFPNCVSLSQRSP